MSSSAKAESGSASVAVVNGGGIDEKSLRRMVGRLRSIILENQRDARLARALGCGENVDLMQGKIPFWRIDGNAVSSQGGFKFLGSCGELLAEFTDGLIVTWKRCGEFPVGGVDFGELGARRRRFRPRATRTSGKGEEEHDSEC
jgi:hypothetical protein